MPNNPKDVRAGAGPRAGSENGGVSLGVDRPAPLSGNDNGAPSASMPKESLEGTKKIGTFHALGIRNFRLLWISTLFSSTGMWIQMATMGWLVYDLTGSGTLLGAMNGMRAIPMLLLAPLAGVVADRLNRRTVLMGVQLVILVTTLGLAIGLALDQVTLWHLFLFTLIGGTVQVFGMPVQQTVVFDLVPRHVIPNAVSLGSTAFNVTRVLGPTAAGFLIAWLGPEGNFFVQSAAYFGVLVTFLMIVFPPRKAASGRSSVARNIAEGFSYIAKDPTARVLLVLALIPPLFVIPAMMALMPVFAKDVFHSGPAGLGLLMSASGLGGLFGGLFVASLGRFERRGLLQIGMLLLTSVALFAFTFTRSIQFALPILVVVGFSEMVYMITNQTILQLSVPDHMRGRIISLFMLTMSLMPVGSLFLGSAADFVGAPFAVRVSSSFALLAGLLITVFVPRVRNLRLSQIGPAESSAHSPRGTTA